MRDSASKSSKTRIAITLAMALACWTPGLAWAQEEPPAGVIVDGSGLWWFTGYYYDSDPWTDETFRYFLWRDAVFAAESFAVGDYDDWRLPTVSELLAACIDGTLPDWLWENGLIQWVGGASLWSSEARGNRSAWTVRLWIVDDPDSPGSYRWEWAPSLVPKISLQTAFLVRGGPADGGKKPRK
jgi:hypothetical protein